MMLRAVRISDRLDSVPNNYYFEVKIETAHEFEDIETGVWDLSKFFGVSTSI